MLQYKSPRPARPRPGTPEFEERLDFLFDENPPFYFPLCILYEGLGSIPPYGQAVGYDPTTNRVLDAIRERWLAMTDRVSTLFFLESVYSLNVITICVC